MHALFMRGACRETDDEFDRSPAGLVCNRTVVAPAGRPAARWPAGGT